MEQTSPPIKLYNTYNYDPRTDATKHGYQGTRFTKIGFVGGGTDGVGGIFNSVQNSNSNHLKYSTVFSEINTPHVAHIIQQGNYKNYAQGYPDKLNSLMTLASRIVIGSGPLPRYFESGEKKTPLSPPTIMIS